MDLRFQHGCLNIDWDEVPKILDRVGMTFVEAERHKIAFENSHTTIFAFDGEKMIGFGRAISDGAYEAAIYDIAVLPEYQGKGIGSTILKTILESLPHCNFILFATPGREYFYENFNFKLLKTGMAIFTQLEAMQRCGLVD